MEEDCESDKVETFERQGDPVKIVVIGDTGVGKTTLINRFYSHALHRPISVVNDLEVHICRYVFNGVMRLVETVEVPGTLNNFLHGEDPYFNADILVFMFDLSDVDTFYNLRNTWFEETAEFVAQRHLPVLVLANKNDLGRREEFPFTFEQIEDYIPIGGPRKSVVEMSALNGEAVISAFEVIMDLIFQ